MLRFDQKRVCAWKVKTRFLWIIEVIVKNLRFLILSLVRAEHKADIVLCCSVLSGESSPAEHGLDFSDSWRVPPSLSPEPPTHPPSPSRPAGLQRTAWQHECFLKAFYKLYRLSLIALSQKNDVQIFFIFFIRYFPQKHRDHVLFFSYVDFSS